MSQKKNIKNLILHRIPLPRRPENHPPPVPLLYTEKRDKVILMNVLQKTESEIISLVIVKQHEVIPPSWIWNYCNSSKSHQQGSRLTFQLASPVASDRFDSPAKTNFSPARYSNIHHCIKSSVACSMLWMNKCKCKSLCPWFSQNCLQNFRTGAAKKHSFFHMTNSRFS